MKAKINWIFIALTFILFGLVLFQGYVIGVQKKELDEWASLEKMWREKMDTCMNRNERIYNELYTLQEYKIMKLKEEMNKDK